MKPEHLVREPPYLVALRRIRALLRRRPALAPIALGLVRALGVRDAADQLEDLEGTLR